MSVDTNSEAESNTNDTLSLDDITVERGDDGELLAKEVYVEELDAHVKARPMTNGAQNRYLGAVGEDGELSNEDLAGLFSDHIVKPDLSDIDAAFIENDMKPGTEEGLLFAVLLASDMDDGVEQMRDAREAELNDEQFRGDA